MLGSSNLPPPYAVPLPGWEFICANSPSVIDLLKEENDDIQDDHQTNEKLSKDWQKMLKIRTVKYYDEMRPEIMDEEYACLAKTL